MALTQGGEFPPYEFREYPKAVETPDGVIVVADEAEEAALNPQTEAAEPTQEPAHAEEPEASAEAEPAAEPEA